MNADNTNKRPIIYIGRRMLANDKEGVAFITPETLAEVTASAEFINQGAWAVAHIDQHASFYEKPKRNVWSVGGIYNADCTVDDDGKIKQMRFGSLEFVKMHETGDMLAGWRAADMEVATEKAKKAAERRAEGNTRLDTAIGTIRDHYRNVPYSARRGFEFWLLDQLKAK